MTFDQICKATDLPPEAVRFYVESKLIAPLYAKRSTPDEGEYADDDIERLKAIANLRRLDVSIEDIRIMLLDTTRSSKLQQETKARVHRLMQIATNRLDLLALLDFSNIQTSDELIHYLGGFDFSTPLPRRDIDQDEGQQVRNDITKREQEIKDLFHQLNDSERIRKRQRTIMMILLILLIILLGWIIAPIWIAYLPKP